MARPDRFTVESISGVESDNNQYSCKFTGYEPQSGNYVTFTASITPTYSNGVFTIDLSGLEFINTNVFPQGEYKLRVK